jgi:hypothetical protein
LLFTRTECVPETKVDPAHVREDKFCSWRVHREIEEVLTVAGDDVGVVEQYDHAELACQLAQSGRGSIIANFCVWGWS